MLPLHFTNAAVLAFGILTAVCWLISMLLVGMGVAFDAATGNLNWSFYGGPVFGITFGFWVLIALCGGVSFLLGWIEKEANLTANGYRLDPDPLVPCNARPPQLA